MILHKNRPRIHTSTLTMNTTQLLYLIMKGKQVDSVIIITDEIKIVAENGKQPVAGAKSPRLLSSHAS